MYELVNSDACPRPATSDGVLPPLPRLSSLGEGRSARLPPDRRRCPPSCDALISLSGVKKHRVWSTLRARRNDATPARAEIRPKTRFLYPRQRYQPQSFKPAFHTKILMVSTCKQNCWGLNPGQFCVDTSRAFVPKVGFERSWLMYLCLG